MEKEIKAEKREREKKPHHSNMKVVTQDHVPRSMAEEGREAVF